MTDRWLKSFIMKEIIGSDSDDNIINEDLYFDPAKFVEVDTTREPINIVFIGHVDSGKSTTCGRILVSSNAIDKVELKKFKSDAKAEKRESWWIAYVMDLNPEERAKGKTVEVGKAFF